MNTVWGQSRFTVFHMENNIIIKCAFHVLTTVSLLLLHPLRTMWIIQISSLPLAFLSSTSVAKYRIQFSSSFSQFYCQLLIQVLLYFLQYFLTWVHFPNKYNSVLLTGFPFPAAIPWINFSNLLFILPMKTITIKWYSLKIAEFIF